MSDEPREPSADQPPDSSERPRDDVDAALDAALANLVGDWPVWWRGTLIFLVCGMCSQSHGLRRISAGSIECAACGAVHRDLLSLRLGSLAGLMKVEPLT